MNINRLVKVAGSRPVVLQPDSFYPYNLTLEGYNTRIPSKALIRMWLQTDLGEERSSPIYLTWEYSEYDIVFSDLRIKNHLVLSLVLRHLKNQFLC